MRYKFDRDLESLDKKLIEMGSLIEEAIKLSSDALIFKKLNLINDVENLEHQIDLKEREIETFCFRLIAEQQPVAKDLRVISSALKIITDMERIGDHAEDIAEIVPHIYKDSDVHINSKTLKDIEALSTETMKMLKESIDSFVSKDVELSKKVIKQDDIIDELFTTIKSDLIDYISENKANAEYALDLLMIAKYFERIGDHAENIAEWVVYKLTGVHKDID